MNKIYKFLITLLAAGFISGTALAGTFNIGFVGSSSTWDTEGTEFEGDENGGGGPRDKRSTDGSNSKDVEYPSIFVEYTMGEGAGGNMTIGIEYIPGDASLGSKARTDANDENSGSNDGTYTAKAMVEDHMTLYLEPTWMMTDNFGAFFTVGASHVEVISQESIALGTDSSAYGDAGAWGGMVGAGFKMQTAAGLFAKVDVRGTRFETIKLKSSTGNKNTIHATPEEVKARLAIGWAF
tara:strand:+ start:404 stop:1117 length:714 start_codon:yes stop_codon:yes gene_type:complete